MTSINARKLARCALIAVVLSGLIVAALGPQRVVKTAAWHLRRGWLILSGRLIDVGGYRLRIEREGKGSPTVVMDAGLCQVMKTWDKVVSEIAKFTQVVVYDRAGLGGSDLGPRPRTSQENVNELHALLNNAGIAGPYVLVGHSFGGINVRLYASQYPAEVAGVVLIDASYEQQYLRFAAIKSPEERTIYLRHESGENCEKVNLIASGELVYTSGSLPVVPVMVLTADPYHGKNSTVDAEWAQLQMEMQSRLAQRVSKGKQSIVAGSGHFIQLDQPQAVIDSVLKIINAARNQRGVQSQSPVGEPAPVKLDAPARNPARP